MVSQYRLSLKEAIFVNMNIMIGAGIFVNTIPLSERIGIFSPFSYILVGIILLPLIFSMMKLVEYYPEGGFYTYAASELSERFGFAASWSYFIGKMASATLVLSFSVLLFQKIIPWLQFYDKAIIYCIFLSLILFINSMGMRLGSFLQKLLVYAKFLPIGIVLLIGVLYINRVNFFLIQPQITDLIKTIPMVLYAASGFETACVLSLTIQAATKNASRAIIFSYGIVLFIAALYQFFAYVLFSNSGNNITEYTQFFQSVAVAAGVPSLTAFIYFVLCLGLAYSALGSAFGMFYSNIWNFFTLAKNKHLPGFVYFTKMNKFGIPLLCILAEAVISLFFLFISAGKIILLQQCSSLALSFTFAISVFSLYKRQKKENSSLWLPMLAFVDCIILITASIYSLMVTNAYSLILFISLFFFGIAMVLVSERINDKNKRFFSI